MASLYAMKGGRLLNCLPKVAYSLDEISYTAISADKITHARLKSLDVFSGLLSRLYVVTSP